GRRSENDRPCGQRQQSPESSHFTPPDFHFRVSRGAQTLHRDVGIPLASRLRAAGWPPWPHPRGLPPASTAPERGRGRQAERNGRITTVDLRNHSKREGRDGGRRRRSATATLERC